MLSNRSKLFLRKVKAQQGLQVPYIDPNDQFMDNYSMTAPANIEQNLNPDFQSAQTKATKGIFNFNPGQVQLNQTGAGDETGFGNFTNALGQIEDRKGSYEISEKIGNMNIPFLSNWVKSVVGGYDFLESFKDKKKQKAYERNSQADFQKRKEEARGNDFYLTPYTLGRSDKLTRKEGGSVGKFKYQFGGITEEGASTQMDAFMAYYNDQKSQSQQSLDQLKQGYDQRNQQLEQEWKNRQASGLAQHLGAGAASFGEYMKYFGGGMGGGGAAMQQGGMVLPESTMASGTSTKLKTFVSLITPIQAQDIKFDLDLDKDEKDLSLGNIDLKQFVTNRGGSQRMSQSNKIKSKDRYREKQDGGEIADNQSISSQDDLYSADFQSPYQVDNQESENLQNRVYAENPDVKFQNNSNLMSWLFEDEPVKTYTMSDLYTRIYGQQQSSDTNDTNIPKGDIASSHKNPGNIKWGRFASKYGAQPGRQATDGGVFANFPSLEAGLQAQKDLLTSGSYANLTVTDAMKRWSNSGYGADLYPEIANKRMKDLTKDELNQLILRQTERESPTIYKQIYNK